MPGTRKGACEGWPRPPLAGVFDDQRGKIGDVHFSVSSSDFAQGVLRILVVGEEALADEVLRTVVGKVFREDSESVGLVAEGLLGELGGVGGRKCFELVLGVPERTCAG